MTPSVAPVLAIVTVTRNDCDGLARTLASIQEQVVPSRLFEHLVVDGASTDATADVVAAVRTTCRFVSEQDNGVYDAMNKGIRLTSAPYVQFLNSGDTYADTDSLNSICRSLGSKPAWMVGRAVHLHGGARPETLIANFPHIWWRHALGYQPHCHQASIFSRELLNSLGGHSEDFGFAGDFDLILRAGLLASPEHLDRIIVRYEGGGVSAQRGAEIPRLLGDVRSARFGLTGRAARFNSLFVRWRSLRHQMHTTRRHITAG